MMNFSTLLFDLDGTLTDPKIGITKSVHYALTKFNIYVDDLDNLDLFIGPPLAKSFMDLYSFSESQAKTAVEYYREYFSTNGIYENELYEGIMDLLELVSRDHILIVATSKPTVFAEKILNYFNISKYFDFVCGSNLDGTMSDKTEIIKYLIDARNLVKDRTIMIGDRKHDIIGAHNNQIASIGVGYGYGSEEEIINIKPTYHIKTVKELLEAFS
ncbi:HAD family hydrolase [Cohnella soli]|uniref:HAD family hydrolase n=1 Tax=Cohnella soli TaxID=425005 RepID=A0ABW0I224_9BACL